MSICSHKFSFLFVLRINCGLFHVRPSPPLVNQTPSRNFSLKNYFSFSHIITFCPFILLLAAAFEHAFKNSFYPIPPSSYCPIFLFYLKKKKKKNWLKGFPTLTNSNSSWSILSELILTALQSSPHC